MVYDVGSLIDAFEGETFTIVGKGPTDFAYEDLAKIEGPIIFINDSIQLERFSVRAKARYWFAHDANQSIWATTPGVSAVVLPIDDAYDRNGVKLISVVQVISELGLDLTGEDNFEETVKIPRQIYGYRWALDKWMRIGPRGLTDVSKYSLARSGELFLNSGTIHAAIHFAWLCGACKISFIGCDGIQAAGYDERIALRGNQNAGRAYVKIRQVQDQMMDLLRLDAEYLGTPK